MSEVWDDPDSRLRAECSPASYVCPMHPEVTSTEPGTCPECGMKLVAVEAVAPTSYVCPMHPEVTSSEPGTCPECGMKLVAVGRRCPADPTGPESAGGLTGHGGHDMAMVWSGKT